MGDVLRFAPAAVPVAPRVPRPPRRTARDRFVACFSAMVENYLPALTAEGAEEIQTTAHELMGAMRLVLDLSDQQRDFGAAICAALLREAAEARLDDREDAGGGPPDAA